MQVSSRKMIITVIVDEHLFPELRHSDAKMCRRLTYLTTQRCKGCNDIIVISLTTGVMRETIRSLQLSGTSRCASQKDTKRQKWLFTLLSGPFGRGKLGSLGRGSELPDRLRSCRLHSGGFGCSSVSTSSTPSAS